MKRWKLLLCLALVLCLLPALPVKAAAAAEEESYTYTVRLYGGNLNSGVQTITDVPYGKSITLDPSGFAASDERYYVKGIRRAGEDSSETHPLSFEVTEDMDFVVAYGIKGNQVAYTVNYQDVNGNPLQPDDGTGNRLPSSITYYGNVGDQVYVAYRQIPGYEIYNAYNLTMKLKENPAENVFTFVYVLIPEVGEPPVDEEEVVTDQADVNIPGGGVPGAAGPADLIDLDEDDTPLGLLDLGKDAIENGAELFGRLPLGARLGLAAIDLMLVGLLIWFLVRRKNKKKEQST